jgi:hypothetical protein
MRLTTNEGDDAAPAWSPDGTRLLFASDRNLPEGDSDEVYSVGADGSCLTWLTNGTPASSVPSWRPGSGDRYDPGGCDPRARRALIEAPIPRALRGGLWLGSRYRGLLLSRVEQTRRNRYLSYNDCELFDRRACPQSVDITNEAACRTFAFRGLTSSAYRYLRTNGAIVAFYGSEAGVRVLSGHAVTTINLARGNRLPDVYRVIRSLRPFGASQAARRLPPPRVPRPFARRLDSTAHMFRRYRTIERTAAALGIARSHVQRRLRLRKALLSFGPYRFSTCAPSATSQRRALSDNAR